MVTENDRENNQADWNAIANPAGEIGFGLRFDPALFRYIWYCQQLGDVAQGYPWWGRTHAAALEPWTSYPTNGPTEAGANGTALELQPGKSLKTGCVPWATTGWSGCQA
jgi:hypothetical protein